MSERSFIAEKAGEGFVSTVRFFESGNQVARVVGAIPTRNAFNLAMDWKNKGVLPKEAVEDRFQTLKPGILIKIYQENPKEEKVSTLLAKVYS